MDYYDQIFKTGQIWSNSQAISCLVANLGVPVLNHKVGSGLE